MFKSRPLMMLLTGIGLALVLWALVSVIQPQETPKTTPEIPVADVETSTDIPQIAVNEEYTVTPASVLSISQSGANFTLSGTGVAGAGLALMHDTRVMASIKLNGEGEWTLSFTLEDIPNVMELNLLMTTPNGHQVQSDQSVLLVRGPDIIPLDIEGVSAEKITDTPNEDRPLLMESLNANLPTALILLSAPGAHSRVMQTPYASLPSQNGFVLEAIDYDNSGGVIFSGSSLRQGRVRIYANGNPVGESRVDTTGRWSLIFGNILPVGRYNLGVELVAEADDNSTALTLAAFTLPFERLNPQGGTKDGLDIQVTRSEDRIQVGRALYGGGYQFTVVYGPNILVE